MSDEHNTVAVSSLAVELARENRELKAELERANKTISELRYQIRCWIEIR